MNLDFLKDLAFCVMSHKRADNQITIKWLNSENIFLLIPESQKEDYLKNNPNFKGKIITHSDQIKGLYPKIDFAIDYFRKKGYKALVKIDDDISNIRDYWIATIKNNYSKTDRITLEQFFNVIFNLYTMSNDLNFKIFGFGNKKRPYYYSPSKRFTFYSAFDDAIFGYIFEDKLKINTNFKFKMGYDFQLQGIYFYKGNLVDNRYSPIQYNMFNNKGGLAEFRNEIEEKRATEYLREKWRKYIKIEISRTKSKAKSVKFNF